jgi:Family of unknown function (DUF6056)
VAALFVVTVSAYAYLGRFTRYVADDYTLKNDLRARGFWASQTWEYLHWTGRFAYIAAVDAGLLLNEIFTRLLPAILLVLWVVALSVAVKALIPAIGRLPRITVALAIVMTTLDVTPSPFLSLYWMTGSLEYIAPLLLGTFFVALVASRRGSPALRIAAAGLLPFLAGGFNEAYAVAQLTVLVVTLLATWSLRWPGVRRLRSGVVSGCAGSVLSLVILGAAPGNGVRFGVITEIIGTRPSFVALPGASIGFALQFLNDVLVANWGDLLAVGALVALLAARTPAREPVSARRGLFLVLLIVVGSLVALVASFVPAAFVEARMTPIYGQIVPVFIGICLIAVVGWGCGRYVQSALTQFVNHETRSPRWRPIAVATAAIGISSLAAVIPVHRLISIWEARNAISMYASVKDDQAALAQAAGPSSAQPVVVPSTITTANLGVFSHSSFEEMLPDPKWWINRGEAAYYGVGSISARG